MHIKRFNIHTDLSYINNWLNHRGTNSVTRHDLPEMGYIAFERLKPLAAVFLRKCEGNIGIVDSLITNPTVEAKIRDLTLDILINHIVSVAKSRKIKFLLGYTKDENTLMRSIRLGFEQSPHTTVVMNLMKKDIQESK